jgi:hydroxymethylpyrimidine pyrophosphatase-like HAD family hydrolase
MPNLLPPPSSVTPIRLVALDLDNTLVGPSMTITPRVRAALAAAVARGVVITIATGRGPEPTVPFARDLGLHAPLICFQGGLVYDYEARRVLFEQRLDPAVIPIIIGLADAHGWNLQFETPTMAYLPLESNHPAVLMELMRVAAWKRVDLRTELPEVPQFILATRSGRATRWRPSGPAPGGARLSRRCRHTRSWWKARRRT